jgi:hypothetical protein
VPEYFRYFNLFNFCIDVIVRYNWDCLILKILRIVGLPNNSNKPITNTACVRARLCKLQKGALDSQTQVIKFISCLPIKVLNHKKVTSHVPEYFRYFNLFNFWFLAPLSAIFQLCHGEQC